MQTWLIFAFIAPAIYAVNNFIDKYLLSRRFSDYNILPLYTGLMAFITAFIFYFIFGRPTLPFFDLSIILLTGVLTFGSLMLYVRALAEEETSAVIVLFQMTPVFVLILSYLFLHEEISGEQLAGFVLVLGASICLSYKRAKQGFTLSQAFFLILGSDLLWALSGVLMKFATSVNDIQTVLVYESFGLSLGATILFIFVSSMRKAFLANIKTIDKSTLGVLMGNEIVYVCAKSFTYFAYSLGPAAIVGVLGNTQVFFGLIYGYILTQLAPKVFREDMDSLSLTKKFVFTSILFIGILLIY